MKAITAVLQAKRVAIMTGAALCFMALATVPARAQQGDWTDPTGRFALSYTDEGWSAESSEGAPPSVVLSLGHRRLQAFSGRARQCIITEDSVAGGPANQVEQDAWLETLDAGAIERILGHPVSDVAHDRIGDRAIIDYSSTSNQFWLRSRVFRIVNGSQVIHVRIACGGDPPISFDDRSTIDAVLNTLRFLPETTP